MSKELLELGLLKECSHFKYAMERNGEMYKVFCRKPVVEFGGLCSRHSPDAELVKQAEIEQKSAVLRQRQRLEEEILPIATERILKILDDNDAKDGNVIRIWQTTMDRIGLAPVQGIVVEGQINVSTPLDILREMLSSKSAQNELAEGILDAEVVHELEHDPDA